MFFIVFIRQALHEAVRGNQYDVVKYLVEVIFIIVLIIVIIIIIINATTTTTNNNNNRWELTLEVRLQVEIRLCH